MDVVDFEFPADPAGRVLATLIERNKQRITLGICFRWNVAIPRLSGGISSGPRPPSFYFFEELENGIHPTRLNLLVDLIESQVKKQEYPGCSDHAFSSTPRPLESRNRLEHASLIYRLPEEPDAKIIPRSRHA